MENLWKLTRIDYRISSIDEQRAYEEIVRRYHHEEVGSEDEPSMKKSTDHSKTGSKG